MIVEVKITLELDEPKPNVNYSYIAEGSDQEKSEIASQTNLAIINAVKEKLNEEGADAFIQEDDYGYMGYQIDHSFPYGR